MNVTFRPGRPQDVDACSAIVFNAFKTISATHNFPMEIPTVEIAAQFIGLLLSHPGFYSVMAEIDGKLVGSNFLDERNVIPGVGPITVDPTLQNKLIGRQLMEKVMERAASRNAPGVRLVQSAYHNRSLSLYTKLGFDPREPLAVMQGPPLNFQIPGFAVRQAVEKDLPACNQLCRRIHGHDRGGELRDAIRQGTASVVERGGAITGYATVIGFFGHAVGEGNADLMAIIGASPSFAGAGFLLPTRNAELFRWCLVKGLRVVQPMTLMSHGLYNEPAGAFLPSVTY